MGNTNRTGYGNADSRKKSKIQWNSVKTKLPLIIVAIMAVPLIISVLISNISSHSEAEANVDAMNMAQVKLVEHDFKSIVEQNRQVLQTVANSITAREVLKGQADKDAVAAWLKRTDDEVGDGNSMVIANADGMQIVRAVGECVDVSDREYFKKAKETKAFFVSDQNISKTTGARICTFIHPVLDDDGTFIGAVQRNYNLSTFTQMLKDEITSEKQDIFIGDNNGDLIGHTSMDLEGGEPVNFSSQQWYTASRDNREATGAYPSKFNGGNWKMSYLREPVTGWVTVIASDVDVALANNYRTLFIIVTVGIVMLVVSAVIAILLASSFTGPIIAVNNSINSLSNGEFLKLTDQSLTKRPDEFGDIVRHINELIDKFIQVVENIKGASVIVSDQARELSDTSGQISSTTDDVSNAVQDMAKGATEQAGSIEKASGNLTVLSDAIQTVASNAEQLAEASAQMNDVSQSSAQALGQLSESIRSMSEAMQGIRDTMNATNAAVQNVNDKVDGIANIASQTNLLALNASIEAARAGETGRGFAVVAEEIGKLASESADTADEIRKEMSNLLKQSQEAIQKTNEAAGIGESVNEVVTDTVDKINLLIDGVGTTVEGVNTISGLTEECDASKVEIVDAMSSLSAISQQNAASTEETSASMEELNATINVLAESANNLNDVAERLNEELQFFKI